MVVVDNRCRDFSGAAHELGVGDDLVDQAPVQCLIRSHEVAGERDLPCSSSADGIGEKRGQPPTGHDANTSVSVREPGMF